MQMNGALVEYAGHWLENALQIDAGDVLLTSPYLSYAECARMGRAAQDTTRKITLCTVLDPFAVARGYLSVEGLRRLTAAGVGLRHVNRLHAKCFIVGEQALVGSGNLTGAGLGYAAEPNREIGVKLAPDQVAGLRATIGGWPAEVVTKADLDDLAEKARSVAPTPERTPAPADTTALRRAAEQVLLDAQSGERQLWVKVEYGEPKLEAWLAPYFFASPGEGPPSFTAGDLVLMCATGTNDCYAIVEVTHEPEWKLPMPLHDGQVRDAESVDKWPWVVRTEPRLVPPAVKALKRPDLGLPPRGGPGHMHLRIDQFAEAVRFLSTDGVTPGP